MHQTDACVQGVELGNKLFSHMVLEFCWVARQGVMVEPRTAELGELWLQDVAQTEFIADEVGESAVDEAVGLLGQQHVPLLAVTDGIHPPILLKQRDPRPLCLA